MTTTLWGQTAQLSGKILGDDDAPVPLAVVEIVQAIDSSFVTGSIADDQGHFVVERLAAGAYLIKASSLGYTESSPQFFDLKEGEQKVFGEIRLAINAMELETVVVKTKKPLLEQKIDMTVLNLSKMITDGKNAIDILRFGPGILVDDNMGSISMNNKSRVTIMVNGKRLAAEGEEMGTLRAISANNIEKVEVITNPSARYEAEGTGGIINIVLKKDGDLGTKFFLEGNYGYALNSRIGSSLTINHHAKKAHLFSTVNFSGGAFESFSTGERFVTINGEESIYGQGSKRKSQWKSPTYNLGTDFTIDDRQTVGFLVEGFKSNSSSRVFSTFEIGQQQEGIDSILNNSFFNPHDRNYNLVNLNYRFEDTTGHRFSIDLDLGDYNYKERREIENILERLGGASTTNEEESQLEEHLINTYSGKVDWVRPITENLTYEMGAKGVFTFTKNDFKSFQKEDSEETFQFDSLQTNNFAYDERRLSGYVNFMYKYKKFGFQAGLRAEQTKIKGLSVDLYDNQIPQPDSTYLNWFPSFFVSYAIAPRHNARLSYSRRISRPGYSEINPFSYYYDLYSAWQGNPFLGPEYTDNYELSYTYLDGITFSTSYSITNNLVTPFSIQSGNLLLESEKNSGTIENINFNFSVPKSFNNWWDSYFWVGAYGNFFDGEVGSQLLRYEQWGVNTYMSHTFRWNQWAFEASGWYNSPSRNVIKSIGSNGGMNISLSRKILKNKGFVKVAVNDIFKTNRNLINADFNGVRYNSLTTFESRQINVAMNFNFGNDKIRENRKRKTSNEEEKRRL